MSQTLTPHGAATRQKMLEFIKQYWLENKTSPTSQEIMVACEMSSKSVVRHHLRIMTREGMILPHPPRQKRSLVPPGMTITFS